jgi:hypothetical protein
MVKIGGVEVNPVFVTGTATVAAAFAAGVFALVNTLVTRWLEDCARRRLLRSELGYLRLHFENACRDFDAEGWRASERLRRMKYRDGNLVIGSAETLSRLPQKMAEKALFIGGFVRNTNAQIEEAANQVSGRHLTEKERSELRSRLELTISAIQGSRR